VRAIDRTTAIHSNDGDQWVLQIRVADQNVRQAIARAIDRDRLVLDVVGGVGRPQVAPIMARGAQWQLDDDQVRALANALRFAPDDAKELLRRAGTSGSFTISAPDDAVGGRIADSVAKSLRAVGLDVVRAEGGPADLTVVRRDVTDDPSAALASYTCAGGIWCDAEYDAAYARFATSSDPTAQEAAARSAVARLTEGLPEVVLFAHDQLQAYRVDNITGIQRHPEDNRLVVFWPSVAQYRGMVKTPPAASEELPTSTFVLLAVAGLVATALAVVVVDRLVSRSRAQARRNSETANALSASNG
jgi:ABC-type transport system substrate-binding protein